MIIDKAKRAGLTIFVAGVLVMGTTGGAASGAAEPPSAPSGGEDVTAPSAEELRDDVAKIPDSAARHAAEVTLENALRNGEEVLSITAVPYTPVPDRSRPKEAASTTALPAGCGMAVMVSRSGTRVSNITSSTCTSGNWSSAQHDMRLVATHPFTFQQWTKASAYRTIGSASTFQTSAGFTCPNTNATNWSAQSKGYMNKGGVNYQTPWVIDGLYGASCGV